MTATKITKKRAKVLAEIENIVGNNCYNGSIQNYGPGGFYEGSGRRFRYPITMIDKEGEKQKRSHLVGDDITPQMLSSGYYAFGANRLHIIRALNEVLAHLELKHGLKL